MSFEKGEHLVRGISIPDREEDYTADVVELFFDLAFVFAFSRLVAELIEFQDWAAVGRVLLMFTLMWFAWSQFTWAANRVPGNQRAVRVIFLAATVVSLTMAASINSAFADGGPLFVISVSLIILMGQALLLLNVEFGSESFKNILNLSSVIWVGLAVVLVGGFVDTPTRPILWVASLAVMGFGMSRARGQLIRVGHLNERFGLIIIVALGEVVVGVGAPIVDALIEDEGLDKFTVLSLIGAGAFMGLFWWSIFDRVHPSMERIHESREGEERMRFARDVYTIGYSLIVAGIILAAAAVEDIAHHPSEPLDTAIRNMFIGGIALNTAGITFVAYRALKVMARYRIGGAIVLIAVLSILTDLDGWVALLIVDAIFLAMFIVEYFRVEAPSRAEVVDLGAKVDGLIWVGSACYDVEATARFFTEELGMELTDAVPGFSRLTLKNGDRVELFGPGSTEHDQLDPGPVAGFRVADVGLAHTKLSSSGKCFTTDLQSEPDGHRWFYFKGPDGNFYELSEHVRPRPPKATRIK